MKSNLSESDRDYDLDDSKLSDQTHSLISNSEDEQVEELKMKKDTETDVVQRILLLQNKIKEKDQLIANLKDTLQKDDKLKKDMKSKINDMRNGMSDLKNKMENIDDFDDEEINNLLEQMDHKEDIIEPEAQVNDINKINNLINLNASNGISGNALMNDYEIRLFFKNSKSCWGKVRIFINKVFAYIVPFKKDIKFLNARFDRNISSMFIFFRILFIFNIMVFLTSLYFLITHLLTTSNSYDESLCKVYFPCKILYSRFTSDEKSVYTLTLMAICCIMFIGIIYNWTDYKRHDLLQDLFESQNINFSKVVFNIWDWRVNSLSRQEDTKSRLKNIFTIGLIETEIAKKIKNRSTFDKVILYIRRGISLFLSIVILVLDAVAVFGLYYTQAYLVYKDEDKKSNSFTDYIAMILPSVGIIIVNAIINVFLDLCLKLEKWDFNSTVILQSIWRGYISKLFTQGVVYSLIIMFMVLEKTPMEIFHSSDLNFDLKLVCSQVAYTFEGTQTPTSLNLTKRSFSNYANCKEDEAASTFVTNLLIDFASRKITPLVVLLIRYIFFKKIKKQDNFKQSYNNITSVSSILMFNIQIYLIIPIFPYILMISPILLYLDIKYEALSLKYFYDKPEKLTMEDGSGYLTMTLFTFTILGVIVLFIFYLLNGITHYHFMECYTNEAGNIYEYYNDKLFCGPFSNEESPKDTLYTAFQSNSVISFFYNFFSNPVYVLIIGVLFLIVIIYNLRVSNAFKFYIKEKKKEMDTVQSSMNEIIKKLRDQIKVFKYGVREIR